MKNYYLALYGLSIVIALLILLVLAIDLSSYFIGDYDLYWPLVVVGFGLINGAIAVLVALPFSIFKLWNKEMAKILILTMIITGSLLMLIRSGWLSYSTRTDIEAVNYINQ